LELFDTWAGGYAAGLQTKYRLADFHQAIICNISFPVLQNYYTTMANESGTRLSAQTCRHQVNDTDKAHY
jgi:hypothetical protein